MATIKGPKGRMTKPLVTPFEVGNLVMLTVNHDSDPDNLMGGRRIRLRAGEVGVIRRIAISDPNDGDDTFLVFDVKWRGQYRGVYPVGADEIAGAGEILPVRTVRGFRVYNGGRCQLATLNVKEGV